MQSKLTSAFVKNAIPEPRDVNITDRERFNAWRVTRHEAPLPTRDHEYVDHLTTLCAGATRASSCIEGASTSRSYHAAASAAQSLAAACRHSTRPGRQC
jgi:hypothetical protein